MAEKIEINRNFISADRQQAVSSYNELFKVGEIVKHQDKKAGEAQIEDFEIETETAEVLVTTTKGTVHLDFLIHL